MNKISGWKKIFTVNIHYTLQYGLYEAKQYDETVHWVRYTSVADCMELNNTTKQYTEYGTPVLLIVWSKTIQRNSTLSTVHQCCWLYGAKQYNDCSTLSTVHQCCWLYEAKQYNDCSTQSTVHHYCWSGSGQNGPESESNPVTTDLKMVQ